MEEAQIAHTPGYKTCHAYEQGEQVDCILQAIFDGLNWGVEAALNGHVATLPEHGPQDGNSFEQEPPNVATIEQEVLATYTDCLGGQYAIGIIDDK